MKKLFVVCLVICSIYTTNNAYPQSSVKLEDRVTSGQRTNVDKHGSKYGMVAFVDKEYHIANKDDDASPNYYGFVAADGTWLIIKETISAGNDTYTYDSGTSAYSTAWTGRAGLTYQAYDTEM